MAHPCPIIEGILLITHHMHTFKHMQLSKSVAVSAHSVWVILHLRIKWKKGIKCLPLCFACKLIDKIAHTKKREGDIWKETEKNQFTLTSWLVKELERERCYTKRKKRGNLWLLPKRRCEQKLKCFILSNPKWIGARMEERKKKNQWISGCGERDGITNGICQWGTAAAK